MKIVIVSVVGLDSASLLENANLETVRNLMASGCYGSLEIPIGVDRDPLAAILERVAQGDGRVVRVDADPVWDQAVSENGERRMGRDSGQGRSRSGRA